MFKTKTKQWGNSMGIIIPSKTVKELNLKPDQELVISIEEKTNPLEELFGALKFKRSTEELLNEVRKNESKYL